MKTTATRITAKRAGRLLTFTRAIKGVERRVLTIDIWAPPEQPSEMQHWFLRLLGTIWWNITEAESYVRTTRDADRMVALVQQHREAWETEREGEGMT